MPIESLADLLEDELKDLYSAENQLIKALPKMAKKASSADLKKAFTSHLAETKGHVQRLEEAAKSLDIKLKGKTCKAMQGLVEEGDEILEEDDENAIIDAALIGAAQRVEHYEIAAYGTVRAIAEQLGHDDIVKLLQETLDEEGAADEKLTALSTGGILEEAANAEEEETADR